MVAMPDPMTAATAAVLTDRITLTGPGDVGPNAVIGTLLLRVLHAPALAIGHDRDPASAACAEEFARFAVHGGFATDRGFTWNRPTIHLTGTRTEAELLAFAHTEHAVAAMFARPEHGDGIELRLHSADGRRITEATGLGELRERLATGRPALPFNDLCVGMIIDHRQKGTP